MLIYLSYTMCSYQYLHIFHFKFSLRDDVFNAGKNNLPKHKYKNFYQLFW